MKNKKALIFIAHPDDEVACGGTIAKLVQNGNQVVVAIATDGRNGTHNYNVSPEEISQTRKKEMKNAADVLGVNHVIWMDFQDGTLEFNLSKLKESAFKIIREEKPDIVFTFDPWKRWDPHSDHRTIGFVAVEAAYLADGCWYYPQHIEQGIEPHNVLETFLFHSDEPNYFNNIKDNFETKINAANEHKSQSLQFDSFGEKYLNGQKSRMKSEKELYIEAFCKMNNSDISLEGNG